MIYIKFVVYAILSTIVTFVAWFLVNWWAPCFATRTATLPNWLKWFDTFDADMDTAVRDRGWPPGYWSRVRWLNRNPSYGFNYWVLGCKWDKTDWVVKRNYLFPTQEGFIYHAVSKNGYFNIQTVRLGIRFKLGWKAWNMRKLGTTTEFKDELWGPEAIIPFVFSISKA